MSYSDADPVPPEPGDDRSVPAARSAHRRVLVGTDGSTTAERAVDRALDVARAHGAHLTVLSTGRRAEQVVAVTHARLEGSGVPVTTVATHGEPAGALADEAIARFEELEDEFGVGLARLVAAYAARAGGDRERARRTLRAILDAGRPTGVPAEDARALAELAAIELEQGALDEADRRARASLTLVRAGIGDDESGLKALRVLARVAIARGQMDAAELLLEEAASPRDPGDRTEGWRLATIALADLRLARGDRDAAEALVRDAAEPPCDVARVLERLDRLVERIERTP
ncbi:MAG: universal stress protein [Acidimicrobiales bacterium]|nr:universal stress protein [Acidimicrobiales bacterium]